MSNTGTIVQIIGPVVDAEFNAKEGALPKIYDALEIDYTLDGKSSKRDPRGPAAPRRELGARHRHVLHRGTQAGHGRPRHWRPDLRARGRGGARPHLQRHSATPIDERGPVKADKTLSDPPQRPAAHRAGHQGAGPRDGHQGHRPDLSLHQGRQGGRLRRCRRRQDRRHHGAHQQHRQGPRRLLASSRVSASVPARATISTAK